MSLPHPARQRVQRCDAQGNVLGTAPRRLAHASPGILHLAVMVVIRHADGRYLLQRRRHRLWDGRFDLGCATHVLHLDDGAEAPETSAARCLADEWSLDVPLAARGAFTYSAFDVGGVEREHCLIFEATDDGTGRPHPSHAHGLRWMDMPALRASVSAYPLDYTPWTHRALACLETT